jgi:hypothetical protein
MSKSKNHIGPAKSNEEKDLLRYLNDEMSTREKYAFERKVENDPFVYEALEGFQDEDIKHIAKDLADLKKKLSKAESSSSNSLGHGWKIAAAVALLIVAGFSAWRLTRTTNLELAESKAIQNDTTQLADDFTPTVTDQATDSLSESEKSAAPVETPVAQTQTPTATEQVAETKPQTQPTATDQVAKADNATPQSTSIAEADERVTETLDVTEDEAGAGAGLALEEVVLEEKAAEPLPQEVTAPKLDEFNAITSADIPATDDKAKKETTEAARPAARSASLVANGPVATPAAGMEAFKKYVTDNQQKAAGMVSGNVVLTFSLDAQGMPQNIAVVQSLCQPCDQEAIRLLQNGGAWKYANGTTGAPVTSVTILIRN